VIAGLPERKNPGTAGQEKGLFRALLITMQETRSALFLRRKKLGAEMALLDGI
jgi:hypothetical protein